MADRPNTHGVDAAGHVFEQVNVALATINMHLTSVFAPVNPSVFDHF